MTRRTPRVARLLAVLLLLAPAIATPAARGDEAPAEDAVPPLATDEAADAALDAFREAWKTRGLTGDERTAVRELAMRRLAETQHPKVADRLAKLTRDRDEDIRTLAVMYLGEQRALPGYAGPLVVKAMKASWNDPVYVMFAIESLERLDWRGAVEVFRDLLAHKDEGVRKVAMLTIGDMQEMRLLDEMLALMIELKIDAGVSWEGGEVSVDTGAAGDADQRAAEQLYHDRYGSNARQGRKAGRAMRDLGPVLLQAMKGLTGQRFVTSEQAKTWVEEHAEEVAGRRSALDARAEAQAAAAAELR